MTKNRSLKTLGLLSTGAFALFALTAPSAGAAGIPRVMYAQADSKALTVTVNIPTLAELKGALVAAGAPIDALPTVDTLPSLDQAITISRTGATANHGRDELGAGGFADPLGGVLSEVSALETHCTDASCDSKKSHLPIRLDLPSPVALGHIDIAGAVSQSLTNLSSSQKVGLADIDLSLAPLLDDGRTLAAVGDALDQVTATINTTVLPPVNTAIDNVKSVVDGIAVLQPLKKEIDRVITVDHVKPLPALSKSDLVTGTVLASTSKVTDEVKGAMTGMRATAGSTIVDLKVLGGWISADSIKVAATAYANSVKGSNEAVAESKMDVLNASLGGLLGIHVSADDLIHLADSNTLKTVARDTLIEAGVPAAITDLENAIDILYTTAGVRIEKIANEELLGPSGITASASANSMRIVVEPMLPKVSALTARPTNGAMAVPALTKADYVPTGIRIAVDLPTAFATVGATVTESFCVGSCVPISGLESHWLFAIALLGGALAVRRFVLN